MPTHDPDDTSKKGVKDRVISIEKAPGLKCERCRTVREDVGTFFGDKSVCGRCAEAESYGNDLKVCFYRGGSLQDFIVLEGEQEEIFKSFMFKLCDRDGRCYNPTRLVVK